MTPAQRSSNDACTAASNGAWQWSQRSQQWRVATVTAQQQ
jgi:hypothetical protein